MEGILFSDGKTPLLEEWINPVFGYQAINSHTGRILPTCQRFEIFTWNALVERVVDLNEHLNIDTTEYAIEIIYQSEMEEMNGWILKMSHKDFM